MEKTVERRVSKGYCDGTRRECSVETVSGDVQDPGLALACKLKSLRWLAYKHQYHSLEPHSLKG